ncbi:MAG: aminoglycoside 6-N-acetyltransferase [Alphaproteobacteria bacterium]|nr:aminoglycoside 6-N-acetyltransferase [Alphaproteobacteria bacterium]
MRTIDFETLTTSQRETAAAVLLRALAHVPSAWRDMSEAHNEVATFFSDPERLAIAAIEGERLLGWIGAIRHSAFGWELHPLVVDPSEHGRGCGTLLVRALEQKAKAENVCTLWLGTDDDFGGTNLFGENLYPDVLGWLQRLEPRTKHPYTFYRRLGYSVVGVLPDVDGIGKHDILMAKRIL